LNNQDAPVS